MGKIEGITQPGTLGSRCGPTGRRVGRLWLGNSDSIVMVQKRVDQVLLPASLWNRDVQADTLLFQFPVGMRLKV